MTIGVGIIGASPDRGWAADAHIPALRTLPEFRIAALSTSRRDSAERAARVFDVPLAFDNHTALVARPEVDLVAVTVKVPWHAELVEAAARAGKAIYCEWPLAVDAAEAARLAAIVRARGLHAAVGLQARSAPAIRHIRRLVAEGYVGEVLSTTIVASALNWGADTVPQYAYLLDRRTGATMLSIPFGHAVDALCWCLGEFAELSATMATRRPEVALPDGGIVHSDVADQIAVSGRLAGGAVAAIHFRGGLSRGLNFVWEINGTEGDLQATADSGHIQMLPVTLRGGRGGEALHPIDVPCDDEPAFAALAGTPALSVARAYRSLARDMAAGTHSLPSFEDAVLRHRMLEAIVSAAETGRRQTLTA